MAFVIRIIHRRRIVRMSRPMMATLLGLNFFFARRSRFLFAFHPILLALALSRYLALGIPESGGVLFTL